MNPRTIINLLRLYILENKTWFLQSAVALFIATIILTPILGLQFHNVIFTIYFISMVGRFFQKTKPGEAIRYYTIPATAIERMVAAVFMIYSFWLVMTLLITTGAWLSDILMNKPIIHLNSVDVDPFTYLEMQLNQFGKVSLIISIFLFGSVYFKSSAVGFTFVSIVLLGLVSSMILGVSATWMLDVYSDAMQGRSGMYISNNEIQFLWQYSNVIDVVICTITLGFFYTLTYFKLRETEV